MPDSAYPQDLDVNSLSNSNGGDPRVQNQPSEHLYAVSGQADQQVGAGIPVTISTTPESMPMNTEVSLRQAVPPPIVQRPLYNPSLARNNPTAQPLATPEQLVDPVQTQTIEIAPHPTTNRFPWNPVENPTIVLPAVPSQIPEIEFAPAVSSPSPPAPPVMPPQPATVPIQAPPIAIVPSVAIVPEPVAPPLVPFNPLLQEPVTPPDMVETTAVQPPTVSQIGIIDPPEAEPATIPPPVTTKRKQKPVMIYSESTKQAWHVLKPSKIVKFAIIGFSVVVIVSAFIFWKSIGAPTSLLEVEFLQPILNAR